MKTIFNAIVISALLTTSAVAADSKAQGAINQCRAKAQPLWDKGGRPYEGNDAYRTCLQDEIKKVSSTVIPQAKQQAFQADTDKAVTQITQVYNDIGDAVGNSKGFDPTADASDLGFYEDLLTALYEAQELGKK